MRTRAVEGRTGPIAPLRKLFSFSRAEWRYLISAQIEIMKAAWRLRRVRIGDLVSGKSARGAVAARRDESRALSAEDAGSLRARELALALERAAEYGVLRPKCLVRSIALQRLLGAYGVGGSEIRVGVRMEGEELLAHAWVELNGAVLGDRPAHVSRFVPIEGLTVKGSG